MKPSWLVAVTTAPHITLCNCFQSVSAAWCQQHGPRPKP